MATPTDFRQLEQRWTSLKESDPHLKIRDAATRLSVSEATLLSLLLGKGARRLRCEPQTLLACLDPFGSLMALTRNHSVVLECHGPYRGLNVQGNVGLMTGAIDLRIDFSPWAQAFAEEKDHAGRRLRSVQFFDVNGVAIHKLYLEDDTKADEWESMIVSFLHEDQTSPFLAPVVAPVREVKQGDPAALLEAWGSLADPHHFHGMLRKSGFDRLSAFEAAEGRFTRRVGVGALHAALNAAADSVPVMFFVGNGGCLQIYTGPIHRVGVMGTWVNVFDDAVNLHADTSGAASAWVVEKPSPDGTVTSLELFDAQGEVLLQMFGKRKPGEPELAAWASLVAGL